MNDLYNKLKLVFDDLNKRRQSDTIANQVHVSSNCNHDSGIQTNLSLIDEINMVVCDIQDLIKNMDFMVRKFFFSPIFFHFSSCSLKSKSYHTNALLLSSTLSIDHFEPFIYCYLMNNFTISFFSCY